MGEATRIRVCGELEVTWHGQPLALPGRQGRLLFAYLLTLVDAEHAGVPAL